MTIFRSILIFVAVLSFAVSPAVTQSLLLDKSLLNGSTIAVVGTIDTGMNSSPNSLVINTCSANHELIYYDENTERIRFVDGNTNNIYTDYVYLPSWDYEAVMVFDRALCKAFLVTTRFYPPMDNWIEARIHTISGHNATATFSVNYTFNTSPNPVTDTKYSINGIALKQSASEGNNTARIILENTPMGTIDVVDLNATGTDSTRVQRFTYRPTVLNPWKSNAGNTLALEMKHESLALDDLTQTDLLYISDPNFVEEPGDNGYIQVFHLNQPPQDLDATKMISSVINLNGTWPFVNGLAGLDIAGPRDLLYIASGLQGSAQNPDNGYLGRLRTTNHSNFSAITLQYSDQNRVLVDWSDSNKVFVLTFDEWYNDPNQGLYLKMIYDNTVVGNLQLLKNYVSTKYFRPSLAYDPALRRVYAAINNKIYVVQENYTEPVKNYLPLVIRK